VIEWICQLSEEAEPAARERALRDAEPLVRRVAEREASSFGATADVDDVVNLVLFELHARGLPVTVATPGSRGPLVSWLKTSTFRRFNRLRQQRDRRAKVATDAAEVAGATREVPDGSPVDDAPSAAEARLLLAVSVAGGPGDEALLDDVLALVRKGVEHAASTTRRKGRAGTIRESFEEVVDLYFERVTKQELLARSKLSREALDQRHTRARVTAIEGLDALLALQRLTPLQHRRAVGLCTALVLVKRNPATNG